MRWRREKGRRMLYYGKINQEKTGARIRNLMKARGFTPNEMAKQMGGVSVSTIYKWCQGYAIPSIDNLYVLSRVLKLPIEDILVVEK